MSGEYNFDEVITPSLTLEPEPVVETTLVAQPEKEDADGPVLTPEEQAMVAAFAETGRYTKDNGINVIEMVYKR